MMLLYTPQLNRPNPVAPGRIRSYINSGDRMEHRYGIRYPSAIDVYVQSQRGKLAARGRLIDVSISGAFVSTSISVAPLSSVTIEVISVMGSARRCQQPIEAHVIRRTDSGLGIEWKELTPAALSQLVDCGRLAPMVPAKPAGIHR